MSLKTKLALATAAAALLGATSAQALDEITVAYFLEWPMPFQYGKANGIYDEALGVKVNWVSFDTGTAMSAAMASGDVQIAVSQGVPPFVVAASAGQNLQIVDVAVSYSENDNCVVATALEIDKTTAADLAGKKVAVPIGTAAHYGFLSQMNHFGVDVGSLEVVDMAPPDGAVALSQGNVDMACGYGGGLRRMKEHGNVLLTGAEKEELGILVFDVTSTTEDFAAAEGELLSDFLKVTADMNAMWNAGDKTAEMLPVIAKDAGMSEADAAASLATFTFPSVEEQLSAKWLGGGAQAFMGGVADVFKGAGSIPSTLDSYEGAVDASFLQSASE
ncbi:Sulfate starvation-induced protein 1 [Tritonibacter multivorans]|uniref:Sulfate starvation-induced protein 1 n=1 Tax=Tritonibacter multivorans TaxID=928856 RepID=A0A0P1GT98_9RHOB|nr:ABC transporter substrate-binding protein [Tritonibacter multivorans]MDA7422811.1 ABC transporter substrate-binding protein [Tritonibacter multivorans]CUH77299.1 Sulfate starvation-induced protein 1 [Tritonibacter multivorans]SFD59093.1 taurine transport system substrate-binding protein [Tritonibacter multivorans]